MKTPAEVTAPGPRNSAWTLIDSRMRTALDLPADKLDALEQAFVAQIREHGWHSTSVLEDDEGPDNSLREQVAEALGAKYVEQLDI